MSHPTHPLTTLVIAAYRTRPEHLRAALASVFAQTDGRFEVIVSDDSPSNALQLVVNEFADPRLSYRLNEPPLGPAANHWACFRDARGEFIVILNHDDVLEPGFLEAVIPPLQADPALAIAFCDHWVIDEAGAVMQAVTDDATRRYRRSSLAAGAHRPIHQLLLDQTIPMAMGAAFRRAALPSVLPEKAGPAYDLWLTYLLARSGFGAWYVPRRLSRWRAHVDNQTTLASMGLLEGAAECWAAVADDDAMRTIRSAARARACAGFVACSRIGMRRGVRADALRHARRAIRFRLSARSLVALGIAYWPRI